MSYQLSDLLVYCLQTGGTELVVAEGMPPALRVQKRMIVIPGADPVPAHFLARHLETALPPAILAPWQTHGQHHFCAGPWHQRLWRVRLSRQARGGIGHFKPLPLETPELSALGTPDSLRALLNQSAGLIVFAGPSGAGKTTTAAAFVSVLCSQSDLRVRILQKVPEYRVETGSNLSHRCEGSFDMSRELRLGIRSGTDLFFTGDIPLEHMDTVLEAADAGALVVSTLRAGSIAGVLDRILARPEATERERIRNGMAQHLKAVVIQHLLPISNSREMAPAWEIIYQNPAFSAAVRNNEYYRFPQILQAGMAEGMLPLDESLQQLVQSGRIASADAARIAFDPGRFA